MARCIAEIFVLRRWNWSSQARIKLKSCEGNYAWGRVSRLATFALPPGADASQRGFSRSAVHREPIVRLAQSRAAQYVRCGKRFWRRFGSLARPGEQSGDCGNWT